MIPEAAQSGWKLPASPSSTDAAVTLAMKTFGLPEVLARLLVCRGVADEPSFRRFLAPQLDDLHDPLLLRGMAPAIERLERALQTQEPILIYGDYDVDGTVATVVLKTALERTASARGWPRADVRYHVPHRLREGYGMREDRIVAAATEGVRLVISVDTGIRAFVEAEVCSRIGLDLIVTDHHLPDEAGVPAGIAVINPNQPGCPYPFKDLCGAAVAFKLAQALLDRCCTRASDPAEAQRRLREKTLPSFLKLIAVATIADAVPLIGENRTIAWIGLRELQRPVQPGLRALMQLAGIDLTHPISATDIGFRLGPRLNAAGRMDVATDVIDLLLSRDAAEAQRIAEKLHNLNTDRRTAEADALKIIDRQLQAGSESEAGLPPCLVLDDAGAGWHRGVLGILASRVVERTGRPALILTLEAEEAHGSGRSVPGFHLLDAITTAHTEGWPDSDGLFGRFGGHAHAVGFALPSSRVPALRQRLEQLAAHGADDRQQLAKTLLCDAELPLSALDAAFWTAYERLEPFGHGFHEPLFIIPEAQLASDPRTLAGEHLRLELSSGSGSKIDVSAWRRRVHWPERAREQGWRTGTRLSLAVRLRLDRHPIYGGWKLELVDAVSLH